MNTATIRERLHNYLDVADDKKVMAIYTLLEHEVEEEDIYTDEFKAELDRRYEDYKSGKSEMITREESKHRINAILKEKFPK